MIFYNSSMPRAGSTLLQNILAQNPDIHATPTDGVLELLFGARKNYTECPEFKAQDQGDMLGAWRGFCRGGLKGYVSALSTRPNTCIKSRGIGIHLEWFQAFMGEQPKVICMVRNAKAVFSSYEKLFRAAQESHQGIQNHAQLQGTTAEKRVALWLRSAPIGLAMERFAEMRLRGTQGHCLIVRYEDLTKDPEAELHRIYEYLELEQYTHDFDRVAQVTQEDDVVFGMAPALHVVKPRVESPVNDWQEVLGRSVCEQIDVACAEYQQAYGYAR